MNPKSLLITALLIVLVGASYFLFSHPKVEAPVTEPSPVVEEPAEFVTDIDPDVSHWQMKETEFFTIKFPKEWYWIELSAEKTEYRNMHVISNNPKFQLEDYKNDPIGMTGIQNSVLSDTEVVVTFWATPTSNSGTSLDALDYLFYLAHEVDSTAQCERISERPSIIAVCSVKQNNGQVEHKFYKIDDINSFVMTVRTTIDTVVPKDILEKVVETIQIKY